MRTYVIAVLVLAILGIACDEKPAGPPFDLRSLSVRVDGPAQITPPAETQFTAVQTLSDGSTRDVTAIAKWTSSNPSVLSVSAGLAKAITGGEVGLTAEVEGRVGGRVTSQPKAVQVVPLTAEWEGAYTLSIAAGPCITPLPLPAEVRQRTYPARIRQSGLNLTVSVSNVGEFGGRVINPRARFSMSTALTLSRGVRRVSLTDRNEPRFSIPTLWNVAYWEPPGFVERYGGYRFVITGEAITEMSPRGFTGPLNGVLALYEPTNGILIGTCTSSSHAFSLTWP